MGVGGPLSGSKTLMSNGPGTDRGERRSITKPEREGARKRFWREGVGEEKGGYPPEKRAALRIRVPKLKRKEKEKGGKKGSSQYMGEI